MTPRRTALPDTDCETCAWAEMTSRQRIATAVRRIIHTPTPLELHAAALRARARVLAAYAGAPTTSYDRHRAHWIEHGDPAELARMLRHVTL